MPACKLTPGMSFPLHRARSTLSLRVKACQARGERELQPLLCNTGNWRLFFITVSSISARCLFLLTDRKSLSTLAIGHCSMIVSQLFIIRYTNSNTVKKYHRGI